MPVCFAIFKGEDCDATCALRRNSSCRNQLRQFLQARDNVVWRLSKPIERVSHAIHPGHLKAEVPRTARVPCVRRDEQDLVARTAERPFRNLIDRPVRFEHLDRLDTDQMVEVMPKPGVLHDRADRKDRTVRQDRKRHTLCGQGGQCRVGFRVRLQAQIRVAQFCMRLRRQVELQMFGNVIERVRRLNGKLEPFEQLAGYASAMLEVPPDVTGAPLLTDNYAPVDALLAEALDRQ